MKVHFFYSVQHFGKNAAKLCLGLLTVSFTLTGRMLVAQPQVNATPSIVVGTSNACGKQVSSMAKAESCRTAPLSTDQSTLVSSATSDLNKIIASEEFHKAVLAANFTETNGLSNEEIYQLIVSHSPVHLDIKLFIGGFIVNKWDHTQGFEDDAVPNMVFGNLYAIRGQRGFLGSLMLHEAMHVLGFHHYERPYTTSVPYTMNTIYDEVAKELGLATSYADAE